mmetsp:Transcript_57650/g.125211  ORF Transcript_57650/g.125211 Transcript_57650/m.125211 type:complete len:100 (-) Transcript_57650:1722-2021(-)
MDGLRLSPTLSFCESFWHKTLELATCIFLGGRQTISLFILFDATGFGSQQVNTIALNHPYSLKSAQLTFASSAWAIAAMTVPARRAYWAATSPSSTRGW